MKNKAALPVILIFVFLAVFLISVIYNRIGNNMAEEGRAEDTQTLIDLLCDRDITIYWIGDLPYELNALSEKEQFNKIEQINDDTMPVKSVTVGFKVYDEGGNLVSEETPKDYTDDLLIVVNNYDLNDEELSVVHDSVALNNVPVLMLGGDTITEIRESMLLTMGTFGDDDVAFYSKATGTIKDVADKTLEGYEYYDKIVRYLVDFFDKEDETRQSVISSNIESVSQMQETSTTEEETSTTTSEDAITTDETEVTTSGN